MMNLNLSRNISSHKFRIQERSRFKSIISKSTSDKPALHHKRAAAKLFVNQFVKDGQIVGLGTGELANLAIQEIGARLAAGSLKGITGVPAADAAAHEAAFHGLPLTTLDQVEQVDLFFDEVDQVDLSQSAAIKGMRMEPQQPQLLRLRALLKKAQDVVFLVDSRKVVLRLTGPLPVTLDAEDWEEGAEELDDLFLGDAEIWRRPAEGSANPRGGDNPYVSPEGHTLVDIRFYEGLKLFDQDVKYSEIQAQIQQIGGVLAHGLLLGISSACVISDAETEPRIVPLKN